MRSLKNVAVFCVMIVGSYAHAAGILDASGASVSDAPIAMVTGCSAGTIEQQAAECKTKLDAVVKELENKGFVILSTTGCKPVVEISCNTKAGGTAGSVSFIR